MTNAELAGALIGYGVAALVSAVLAAQARARGRGFLSWVALQVLAGNPLYTLVLVAMLPNKRRLDLRAGFAAELDAKLGDARPPAADGSAVAFPAQSVGELPTTG